MKLIARQFIAITVIAFGLVISSHVLWIEELQYYLTKEKGTTLQLNDKVDLALVNQNTSGPVYLHFYDGNCTDSRINLEHISTLVELYQDICDFYLINQSNYRQQDLRSDYSLSEHLTIVDDSDHRISKKLEIASTPHVLILDDSKLYFSGNYNNANGLCGATNIQQSAPAVALNFLSRSNQPPLFANYQVAFTGCEIK